MQMEAKVEYKTFSVSCWQHLCSIGKHEMPQQTSSDQYTQVPVLLQPLSVRLEKHSAQVESRLEADACSPRHSIIPPEILLCGAQLLLQQACSCY